MTNMQISDSKSCVHFSQLQVAFPAKKFSLCFNDVCSGFRYSVLSNCMSIALATKVPNLLLYGSKLNLQCNWFQVLGLGERHLRDIFYMSMLSVFACCDNEKDYSDHPAFWRGNINSYLKKILLLSKSYFSYLTHQMPPGYSHVKFCYLIISYPP